MKIVIAGGTGYLGELLTNHFCSDSKNQVFILSKLVLSLKQLNLKLLKSN